VPHEAPVRASRVLVRRRLTVPGRIVVVGASFGAGHDSVADAVADGLRRHPSAARVLRMDLLGRCAPKAVQLACLAWRGGEPFFPDGTGTLAAIAATAGGDPLVRELVSGGISSAEATLRALEPDVVVATHPAAGGVAAEVAGAVGCSVVVVLADLMPGRVWLHPGVDLWCVAGADARDELARRGVEWSRIAVTGVPHEGPPDPGERGPARAAAGLDDRFAALVAGVDDVASVLTGLRERGVQPVLHADGEDLPAARAGRRPAGVVVAPEGMARVEVLAAVDIVIAGRMGQLAWEAPGMGTPLVLVGRTGAMEVASADLMIDAGAAVPAGDGAAAARRVAYLDAHPERLGAMAAAASGLGRRRGTQAVCERTLALLR